MHFAWIAPLLLAAPDDSRRWVDEVVYVVIIEKFFDGDPSNNFMKDRFIKDRTRYEGGFWGGDLRGVIDKLDDLVDLGVTAILLYPVMQNDEGPMGKFLPTGYRPKDYEHVDRNFGDVATLRARSSIAELKSAPPAGTFLIVPELTINPREIGKFVTEGGFDGAYDFSAMQVREVFGKDADVGMLSFVAREAKEYYPSPRSMLASIDNYEKAFVSIAKEPKARRTRLALTYLLTLDRVPLLYAGNELGIAFREVGGAFPSDRRDSPFLKDVKALIALRKREPALRQGDFAEVLARDSVYAFLRTSGADRILVVLNGSDRPQKFGMPIGDRVWKACGLEDLIAGGVLKPAGSEAVIEVEAFGARIVRVK